MGVHLSVGLEDLTLADLYRFVDTARTAGLDPALPVRRESGAGEERLMVSADPAIEPAADAGAGRKGDGARSAHDQPVDVSDAVGEVVDYLDQLRRRFGGAS